MAGILDMLAGNDQAASPWGALYQAPQDPTEADKAKLAQQQFLQALLQNPAEGMGNPSLGGAPSGPAASPTPPSPFGDPSQLSVAAPVAAPPAPSPFQAGAAALPFGLAGPPMPGPQPSIPAPAAQPAQPASAPMPPAVANANAAAAPDDENDPIAVGNYQMPRIGAGFPDDDEAPAKPAPGAAAAPVGAPSASAPFSLAGAGSAIGDRLGMAGRGFAGNMSAGPVGALIGGLGSLISGRESDPTAIAAQKSNATLQALVAKGASIADVRAAANNPEIMKTLVTQYFGPDKFQHVTRKDQFGGEEIGAFDPTSGKTTFGSDKAGGTSPSGGVQAMVDSINQKREGGASRADLIKEVPPEYQGYISSLLDGKAVPANIGRGQARGALMTLAHSIDPTFDETVIPARIQTAKDFTPAGKSGASIVAFNTVQHHIGKLSDDLENVGDTGWTALNAIRNGVATNTPLDQKQGKAVQAINDDIKAVTDEMSGAYKAGHISDTEIKSWNSLVSSNKPLPQMRQAISDFVDLLNGKRDALNKVHQQIMGGDAGIIDKEENSMITQKAHDRNAGVSAAAQGAITEGATATNPKTGQTITFRGGKWQ